MMPLLADMGIPMVVVQLPAMLLLLVPVVLIESFVANRRLGIGFKKTASGLLAANLVSTLLGFPLAWAIMLAIEFVSIGALHFLPSVENALVKDPVSPIIRLASSPFFAAWVGGNSVREVLIAALALLIPSFFISVWIERRICMRMWASYSLDPLSVSKATRKANVASYMFLFLAFACIAVYMSATGVVK
jgi:hypothetical protein